jgi:hypothetical protein
MTRKKSARAQAREHAAALAPADELMRAACAKLDALNAATEGLPASSASARDEAEAALDKALAAVLHVRQLRRGMSASQDMASANSAAARADGHQWWADKDAGRYSHLPFGNQPPVAPARGDVGLAIAQFVQRQVEASTAVAQAEAVLHSVASSMLADATSRLSVARSKLPALDSAVSDAEKARIDERGLGDVVRRVADIKLACAKAQGALEARFETQVCASLWWGLMCYLCSPSTPLLSL